MRIKVQLPDYPCHHIVTGLTTGRSATGRKLLLAEAVFVLRADIRPIKQRDLVTLMLLHDAVVAAGVGGDKDMNAPRLYGSIANQERARRLIRGAVVDRTECEFCGAVVAAGDNTCEECQ